MVEPKTGRVPPACLRIVGSMVAMFRPHFLANILLIRVFGAPVSGRELTQCLLDGVASHKKSGGVGDGEL